MTTFVVALGIVLLVLVLTGDRLASRLILGPRAGAVPSPGAMWALRCDDKSPWPSKRYCAVKILDVRDGWVRYDLFDSRLKVDDFVRMYRPVLPAN